MPPKASGTSSLKRMRVQFWSRYSENGASSRCRSFQLVPGLARLGFSANVVPLLSKEYLSRQYVRRDLFRQLGSGLAGVAERFRRSGSLSSVDVLVLEKEICPYAPFELEVLMLRRARRLVVDYDDAMWVYYERSRFLREKISRIMAISDAVVAGSRVIEDYARQYAKKVYLVPTVVDVARYPDCSRGEGREPATNSLRRPFRVGWIGTPVTSKFLPMMANALRRVAREIPLVFVSIGGGDSYGFPGVLMRRLPWTLETEAEDIGRLDVGIMPLQDDGFARGKCGYKLIQYMAAGLPTVASPVGENVHIVRHGVSGFFARSEDEWVDALLQLARSSDLRVRMGAEGRRIVESGYTLQHAVDAYARILTRVGGSDARSSDGPAPGGH